MSLTKERPSLTDQFTLRAGRVGEQVLNKRFPGDSLMFQLVKSPDVLIFFGFSSLASLATWTLDSIIEFAESVVEQDETSSHHAPSNTSQAE